MQRVSRNSIDVTGFEAARAEIRNAEATIVEMEEALTGFSRSGAEVARSYDDVGLAANGALQTIQQQQNAPLQSIQTDAGAILTFHCPNHAHRAIGSDNFFYNPFHL